MSYPICCTRPQIRCDPRPLLALLAVVSACGGTPQAPVPDSAVVAQATADSVAAAERGHVAEMLESARGVLASLLPDSASASFEELAVVQPPAVDGTAPAMVVCGKVTGRPGIGGRSTPTAFVYTSRWSVFVEEAANREAFRALWDRTCGNPGSVVKG